MSKRLLTSLALGLALLPFASKAEAKVWYDPATLDFSKAEQQLSKGGPALKALVAPGGNVGILFGGQGAGYVTESFYLGGAGYGGGFTSGKTFNGGMGYGGMLVGTEQKLGDRTLLDLNLLVGGGGGSTTDQGAGGSFVLEPNVSVSQLFGGGYRGTLSLGYLYMPNANQLSGATVGLSLGFKSLTFTFPIDN